MASLKDVLDFIRNPALSADERSLIVECLNKQLRDKRAQAKAKFFVGQRVAFDPGTGVGSIRGQVIKINRVNIMVLASDGHRWRVSPGLLKVS